MARAAASCASALRGPVADLATLRRALHAPAPRATGTRRVAARAALGARDRARAGRRRDRLRRQYRIRLARPDAHSASISSSCCSETWCCRMPPAPARWLADRSCGLVLVLKIASLAQGYSGVRPATIGALQRLLEARSLSVHSRRKGSVGRIGRSGAAGAHGGSAAGRRPGARAAAACCRADEGAGAHRSEAAAARGRRKGWRCSTARRCPPRWRSPALFAIEDVFAAALVAGALSVDALKGSDAPFDDRIHALRRQDGQRRVARQPARLLSGSHIRASHLDCDRVQDPYSLRCQPQVMGACLDLIRAVPRHAAARGQRRDRQSAGVRARAGSTLRRQFPRRASGARGRSAGARDCRNRRRCRSGAWRC